mmetsp:Transcript_15867/g.55207  ORF Transcript_15867/g.55207 Transcript_15867/m.55207 type:complete len:228 (+) Transcript_15867:548-1231(+)
MAHAAAARLALRSVHELLVGQVLDLVPELGHVQRGHLRCLLRRGSLPITRCSALFTTACGRREDVAAGKPGAPFGLRKLCLRQRGAAPNADAARSRFGCGRHSSPHGGHRGRGNRVVVVVREPAKIHSLRPSVKHRGINLQLAQLLLGSSAFCPLLLAKAQDAPREGLVALGLEPERGVHELLGRTQAHGRDGSRRLLGNCHHVRSLQRQAHRVRGGVSSLQNRARS